MGKLVIIKSNHAFSRVVRRGKSWRSKTVILYCLRNRRNEGSRIGFTTSRQYRSAVSRNRQKRLLREAYHQYAGQVKPGWDVVLTARHREPWPTFAEIQRDVGRLLMKADLLHD